MKYSKGGSGKGDIILPIGEGKLNGTIWYYCDKCSHEVK